MKSVQDEWERENLRGVGEVGLVRKISSSSIIVKPPPSPMIKRRSSRASKKSPTTLLTANADNFRSLVQQFTGCHTNTTAFGAASNYKGPINLSFSHDQDSTTDYDEKSVNHHHHHQLLLQEEELMYRSSVILHHHHDHHHQSLSFSVNDMTNYNNNNNSNNNAISTTSTITTTVSTADSVFVPCTSNSPRLTDHDEQLTTSTADDHDFDELMVNFSLQDQSSDHMMMMLEPTPGYYCNSNYSGLPAAEGTSNGPINHDYFWGY